MTFTQYLRDKTRTGPRASFLHLAQHDALWPANSNRLEEFESFLLARLEEESEEVLPELRELWGEYAHEVGRSAGKHDLDLALAAWGDYARHLPTCSGTSLQACETAQQLLEAAMDASSFDDLHNPHRGALPCGGVEDSDDERDDLTDDDDDDDLDVGEWEEPAELS